MWVIVEAMSLRISGLYNSENDGGPAAFSYWHRRPDHQPEDRISGRGPKSGYQPSNSVHELYAESFTHKTHTQIQYTCGPVAGMLQHSKSKCHCRGGKSDPGKAADTEEVKAAQNMAPLEGD